MRIIFTVIALMATLVVLSQPGTHRNDCRNPLPESLFRQKFKTVMMQRTDIKKLEFARMLALDNCLSSEQVKTIAEIFIDDYSRLEFAETAWERTVDKENFYYVYDAFAYISTVFMLHDFIKENSHYEHPYDPLPPAEPSIIQFAALDYPDPFSYKGPSNCGNILPDGQFIELVHRFSINTVEQNRLALFTQMVQGNCMSVAQIMKLASLLQNENNRLTLFRAAWRNTYDLGNLSFGHQLFSLQQSKQAFDDFLQRGGSNENEPCKISTEAFRDMLESIRKESFNSTKITITKNIIESNPCFYTRQVKEIVDLFTFESGKLEIAKFAYEYTIDKENYYKVGDSFSYSSSKEELIQFIKRKQ